MNNPPVSAQAVSSGEPSGSLHNRIAAFLAAHTTLTLATVGAEGAPTAAAVFYAHDSKLALYFLSEERTEHGRNLLADARVAGAIHADGQDWRGIRGLQVRGQAHPVAGTELAHAAAVYGRKYSFIAGLLAAVQWTVLKSKSCTPPKSTHHNTHTTNQHPTAPEFREEILQSK